MALKIGAKLPVKFDIPATELSAGTSIEVVAPLDGYITEAIVIVQTAVVTGGNVTFSINGTTVNGLTVTVADAATKGTVVTDLATAGHASRAVKKGDRVQVIPAAAFNGGGALAGFFYIETNNTPPA